MRDLDLVLEDLGFAKDSSLGSAPLGRSAVVAQWVAVVDDRLHSDKAGEGDA